MRAHSESGSIRSGDDRKRYAVPTVRVCCAGAVFATLCFFSFAGYRARAEQVITPDSATPVQIMNMAQQGPRPVFLITHVSGTVRVPYISVSGRTWRVASDSGAYREIQLNDYLLSVGFAIDKYGHILVNAYPLSPDSYRRAVVAPIAERVVRDAVAHAHRPVTADGMQVLLHEIIDRMQDSPVSLSIQTRLIATERRSLRLNTLSETYLSAIPVTPVQILDPNTDEVHDIAVLRADGPPMRGWLVFSDEPAEKGDHVYSYGVAFNHSVWRGNTAHIELRTGTVTGDGSNGKLYVVSGKSGETMTGLVFDEYGIVLGWAPLQTERRNGPFFVWSRRTLEPVLSQLGIPGGVGETVSRAKINETLPSAFGAVAGASSMNEYVTLKSVIDVMVSNPLLLSIAILALAVFIFTVILIVKLVYGGRRIEQMNPDEETIHRRSRAVIPEGDDVAQQTFLETGKRTMVQDITLHRQADAGPVPKAGDGASMGADGVEAGETQYGDRISDTSERRYVPESKVTETIESVRHKTAHTPPLPVPRKPQHEPEDSVPDDSIVAAVLDRRNDERTSERDVSHINTDSSDQQPSEHRRVTHVPVDVQSSEREVDVLHADTERTPASERDVASESSGTPAGPLPPTKEERERLAHLWPDRYADASDVHDDARGGLVRYVRETREQGFTDKAIRDELVKVGWNADVVDDVLRQTRGNTSVEIISGVVEETEEARPAAAVQMTSDGSSNDAETGGLDDKGDIAGTGNAGTSRHTDPQSSSPGKVEKARENKPSDGTEHHVDAEQEKLPADEALVQYILDAWRADMTDDEIKKELIHTGWVAAKINRAFAAARSRLNKQDR